MKRLIKKSTHGISSRSLALLYINGEIITGHNHPEIIQNYLKKYNEKIFNQLINDSVEYSYDDYYDAWEAIMQFSEYERKKGEYNSIDEMGLAFGHICNNITDYNTGEIFDKVIFLETNSITNIDINTVLNAIKEKFNDVPVYDDDSFLNGTGQISDYIKL